MRRMLVALLAVPLLLPTQAQGAAVAISTTATSTTATSTTAMPAADVRRSASPRRLQIPAINVSAGIIPVGVTSRGHLAIGRSVRDVYRWRQGVVPGDPGSAVLAGHTWSKGPGVFDNLARLRVGDRVNVGTDRFKVTRVRRVTGMSPAAVRSLFSDRGEARLVLITCGDRNNLTGVYRTRIIVNAKFIPRRHR